MRAALMERFDGPLPIGRVPDPACPADGVVVAVQACGVCRSDHHAWKGVDPDVALPHVMGHELAGEVVEVGPDCHRFAAGDRVTAPFILACGDLCGQQGCIRGASLPDGHGGDGKSGRHLNRGQQGIEATESTFKEKVGQAGVIQLSVHGFYHDSLLQQPLTP